MPEDRRPKAIKDSGVQTDPEEMERRTAEAIRLKDEGLTCRQIGERMGVSGTMAWKYIHRHWERLIEDNDESRRVLREVELDRIEELLVAITPIALASPTELALLDPVAQVAAIQNQPKAAGVVLKCIQTIARLRGLNAPAKIEHSRKQTGEPLEELIARVAASKQRRATMLSGSRS